MGGSTVLVATAVAPVGSMTFTAFVSQPTHGNKCQCGVKRNQDVEKIMELLSVILPSSFICKMQTSRLHCVSLSSNHIFSLFVAIYFSLVQIWRLQRAGVVE
jgi:hypothetical protein